jgi:hypothetical protein
MSFRRIVVTGLGCACVVAGCSAGGSSSGTGGGGASGSGGTGQPTVVNVDEHEPNDGPTVAGAQDLGAFSGDETMIVTGTLSKGGNDGTKYTGDLDVFSFSLAQAGALDVKVEWTESADVDVAIYDPNIKPLASDGTADKPAKAAIPSANGKYVIGVYSKDNATAYTLTIRYTKAAGGGGGTGTCPTTPLLPATRVAGGCTMDAVTPVCAVADLRNGGSFEIDWTTNQTMCEGPHKLQITGDPPSEANSVTYSYSSSYTGNDARMTPNIGGFAKITAADIATVTSTSGIYYYRVGAFYGSATEARAFQVLK